MPLQREVANPLYLQLKDALEREIRAGVYQRHGRLPSERELSAKYGVSRMTARNALVEWVISAYRGDRYSFCTTLSVRMAH